MELSDFVREALDPMRLAVLGHSAVGPVDIDEMAAALGTSRKQVLSIVVRLQQAGLLDQERRLDRARLVSLASQRPSVEAASDGAVAGPWTSGERQILSRFFRGDRLAEIPAARSKRLVVLERLVQDFAPGVRYEEPQVNFTLQLYHADYAALRRYLVDEGFLTRADGVYWRTGGRYLDDLPAAEG